MAKNAFAPVTPGEMLKEEFLVEYGLSQNELAKAIGISPNRIAEIVNNRRRMHKVLRCACVYAAANIIPMHFRDIGKSIFSNTPVVPSPPNFYSL
jgi:hypothetical protein